MVTGYCWPHQYITTIHCWSVKWDFAIKVQSLSSADFLQAVSPISIHTKDYYALGTLYFTELLHTYLYLSVTSLRLCMSTGWLHAGQVLLVARKPLLWNQPICSSTSPNTYGPRSKMLIFVALFFAVLCPPWQNNALRMYMTTSGVQH